MAVKLLKKNLSVPNVAPLKVYADYKVEIEKEDT